MQQNESTKVKQSRKYRKLRTTGRKVRVQQARERQDHVHEISQVLDYSQYKPPVWAYPFVASVLDPQVPNSITKRCQAIGITPKTYCNHAEDTFFKRWCSENLTEFLNEQSQEVTADLVRLCHEGNLEAIVEYHDRYIPRNPQVIEQMPMIRGMRNVTPYKTATNT